LLNITCKAKDGLKDHKDLQILGIREELHPQERPNGKVYLPPTGYTITNEEKHQKDHAITNPHRILSKHKEYGLHVRTKSELL
jgi:hypothetical protein